MQVSKDFLLPNLNTSMTAGVCAIALLMIISYFILHRGIAKGKVAPEAKRAWPIVGGKVAPEAKGAWPIVGHLPLLRRATTPPHITLGAMADKYGPLFTIRLGIHQALVVSNCEMAKECFTINDLQVSSRPKLIASKHFGYNHAMFAFAPYGTYWREIRKLATLQLLSTRRLELLKHIRISEVANFLKQLYGYWNDQEKNVSGQSLVEMKQWFGHLTLNVVLRMVAGKRYSSSIGIAADNVGDDDERESQVVLQKALRDFFNLLGMFVTRDVVPFLGFLDLGGYEKAMKKTAKVLDDALNKWLQEHKRKRAGGTQLVNEEQDFMDVMLSVLRDSDHASFDADTINKSTALNMIAGGSDTTIVTMTWAISLLLNNRQALKKVKDELDSHVGRERVVEESDMNKLVYVQAIVKETLRLYPAAPLSTPREFTEDCNIGGYHIPKGTRLMTNLWKIQTDPQMWEDPLAFKPERFLTTHKDVDYRSQLHFEYLPFGSGRRACPGASFALQMLNFSLASFLHAFEISTPSDAPIDMTQSFGLTNLKETPLEILIKPSLPAKLYV